VEQGAVRQPNHCTRKTALAMLPARPPKKEEPRRSDEDFLPQKSLLLLIIALSVAYLCVHDPHVGAAVVAAITVLALLWKLVQLGR
jgi:hypothetical protein